MLTTEQKKQLVDWNKTQTEYPKNSCVHQLFEEQAACTPDALALVFEGQELTYRQLNEQANQLARYLQKQGVGSDVLVGLCMERSLEMVIGILGILKAGGGYVPLDPEYPQERLTFMLEDAQIRLMVTTSSLQAFLPLFSGEIICLDSDWKIISQECVDNPGLSTTADSLIYVIYTSGSTGKPKGVAVPHRAVIRLVCNTNYFQVTPEDRVAQASNISFDAATFEVWGALLNGAQLVGINKNVLLNTKAFSTFLDKQKITALFITTALFNLIARESPQAFGGLRGLMFGGEAVDPHAVRCVLAAAPPQCLLHVYGPTESTTFSTWYRVKDVAEDAVTVPIGKPLANSTLYVLDAKLQQVSVGVAGELYIGGDGLAREYLNRPELTAEHFIRNPFSDDSKARLYKSGDQVRYLPDGNIEFIGRIDQQVKLRGFRVELGEIESALKSHEAVLDAVIMVREDEGDKRLIAYVIYTHTVESNELRQFLKLKLPEYMLPSAFIGVDQFPLTPNGKVDKKALSELDHVPPELGENYVAPCKPVEKTLAAIWADVLRVEQVGINDHFLDLGGHSLLAAQVVTRVREALGVDLSLADFYQKLTIAGLATRIECVGQTACASSMPTIATVNRDGPLPVSYPQEQVMFLTKLVPDSIAYNAQMKINFVGELDVSALERALSEIVRRHEILRTSFEIDDGRPIQRVQSNWTVKLPIMDFSSLPEDQCSKQAGKIIDEEIHQVFNFSEIPLARWKLLKLKGNEHALLHVEHHLVHDGWSFGIFIHELQALYGAYSTGHESPLAELPIQFADYVVWQRQWLQGGMLKNLLEYWKQKLNGSLPVLQLSTDYQRPPVQSHRGAEEVVDLSPECSDQLRKLSQRENTTLYVTMLTLFFILLHKYSHQKDIIVGTGVANRNVKEIEGLIGMIINTIALRGDLSGDPTIRELLQRVHDVAFEAYAYQELPFEKLVEELRIDRNLAHNPVFQVLFGFHDSQVPVFKTPDLTGKITYLHNGSAKFDLNLVVIPWAEQQVAMDGEAQDRRITMKWEYATDLFTPATVRRMTLHYQSLVQELIDHPDKHLSELDLLSNLEQQKLLVEWNDTHTDYPREKCVHQLFEEQVAQTPDAIAVVYEDQQVTYGELNRRANQLAHSLIKRDIGPEALVGICTERSLATIIGVLGILKTGAAYVPLDPAYPEERLAFMVNDTAIKLLLTQSSLKKALPANLAGFLYLDSDWPVIAQESDANPCNAVTAESLAYVMYTSGSTGVPKGVAVPHRGIARLVLGVDYAEFNAQQRFLMLAPISFDASTFELWGALLHGACCVVYPEQIPTTQELGQIIKEEKITTMWLTAALFNSIIDEAPQTLYGLQQLLTGGEALSIKHIQQALEHLPKTQLINGYGPTEGTTFTCCYQIPRTLDPTISSIPIGRPIANTKVYIFDSYLQPVPVGVPGELYIGGDGLAQGYLHQLELTEEKFIPHPYSTDPKAKLYKTGDLARYLSDGNIEFLGRTDNQVKVRGFRIELGEIESVLCQHENVKEAVVLCRDGRVHEQQLVAYVVAEESSTPCLVELQKFARKRLPNYMLPSSFMVLDSLPLTPNGKVDRNALPAPLAEGRPKDTFVEPSSELEQQLAEIWRDVLSIDKISMHDDFFDLGGHSLMATQVVSRIRDKLHVEVSVAELFEAPNLSDLAERIELIRWVNETA